MALWKVAQQQRDCRYISNFRMDYCSSFMTNLLHSQLFFPAAFANICMCVRFHIKDFLFFSLFHIFFHFM